MICYAGEEHFYHSLLLRRFVFRMAEASAKRVTGDEPQGTMGRVQTAGEAPTRSCVVFLAKKSRQLSPSRLPLREHFHQKRDVWVRGSFYHIFPSQVTIQISNLSALLIFQMCTI